MAHVDVFSRFPVSVMCVSNQSALPKLKLFQENNSEFQAIKKLLEISNNEDEQEWGRI